MTHDGTEHEEAEYEVVGRRQGRIQIEIFVPGEKRPVQHGVSIEKARKNPDGIRAEIEERVQRIAARHSDPGIPDDEEIPTGGKVTYDPRTRDGRPKEELLEPEETKGN